MDLTPIDIQQQQFAAAWRGYDTGEVREFLTAVAQTMANQAQKIAELKAEQAVQVRTLAQLQERENDVKETMLTAQRAMEEARGRTDAQVQIILGKAENEAQRIVGDAQNRHTQLTTQVGELERQKVRLIEELRHILGTHSRILEVHVQESQRRQDVGAPSARAVLDRLAAPRPPAPTS
jgi:cell division initiation protein